MDGNEDDDDDDIHIDSPVDWLINPTHIYHSSLIHAEDVKKIVSDWLLSITYRYEYQVGYLNVLPSFIHPFISIIIIILHLIFLNTENNN